MKGLDSVELVPEIINNLVYMIKPAAVFIYFFPEA